MFELMSELWPLHRTLNCDDMDKALDIVGDYIGDDRWEIHRFKPKTDALTWWIPERYQVNEAWLEIDGKRVADFAGIRCISFLIRCRRRLTARLARFATISGVIQTGPMGPWGVQIL